MPVLLNRRQWLAAAVASSLRAADEPIRWALLSDPHIPANAQETYRGFTPVENLRKTVTEVLASPATAAIVNGDLARLKGTPEDYAAFTQLLAPLQAKMPIGLTMGNHDHRANFLAAVRERAGSMQTVAQRFVSVVDLPATRFLLLDSLMGTDLTPGLLGKEQRQWLSRYLDEHDPKPTILFVHHTLDDGDQSLLDAPYLMEIVLPRRQVKAIVYGHSHTYRLNKERDLHLINLPAIGYNFKDGEPIGWVDATFSRQGADLMLHVIGGGTVAEDRKATTLRWR